MAKVQLPTGSMEIPCPVGQVSDGFHTFDELYEHRCVLFLLLLQTHSSVSWRSKLHADGTMFEGGWFVAGLDTPEGPVTYHLPEHWWERAKGVRVLERAPEWDGHDSAEALARLTRWLERSDHSPVESKFSS